MPTLKQIQNSVHSETEKIELAVLTLRNLAAEQMEDFHTLMDSVILAAEQVQDKRLEMLEQGPEVSAWEVFWDFALVFILESPLAGKVLHYFTKGMYIRRLRVNALAKAKILKKMRTYSRITKSWHLFKDTLPRELKNLHRQMKELADANGYEKGPYPYLVALAKSVKETYGDIARPEPALAPSDTPGVSIIDLAQTYLSRQRLSIQIELCSFEYWLRSKEISPEEIFELIHQDPVVLNGRVVSRQEMKEYFKRVFELLIWTLMLYQRPFTGKYVTSPRQAFTLKDYVQPSLIKYWLKRFIDPESGKPFSETPALNRPDGKPDLEMAIGKMGNYMWEIAKLAADNKVFMLMEGPLKPREKLLME
jgi:hypothetical protein